MEVILIDKISSSKIIIDHVIAFKRNKINTNGRKQWCYICYLEYWNKTYPCNRYEIYTITDRGE